jgi:predicted TIM-barrel fold metal-dependent hydrolase
VLFHAGRAGIEPESSQPYALPRYYEAPLREFPGVQFVLGHAGARDVEAMVEIARRYPNAWLDVHGQGVTVLGEMIRGAGSERLLFGTDWPFYPLAATLAKVLIVTEGQPAVRDAILRENALRLLQAGA